MKKIFKLFSIIFSNIFLSVLLFFLLEFIIYFSYSYKNFKFEEPFGYIIKNDRVFQINFDDKYQGGDSGRLPFGLQYKDKAPLFVFGCSYAYGQYLKDNQTFSYKLSEILKRPVYNRALPGFGIQHMYAQLQTDNFYKDKACPAAVIYVLVYDHFNRFLLKLPYITSNFFNLHYNVENNKLKMEDYNSKFKNILNSLYIARYINHKTTYYYVNNKKNADKLTDLMLIYFMESRNKLEEHYHKKIKFFVVLYPPYLYDDLLTQKLEQNDFFVINLQLLFPNIDFAEPQYSQNIHPTAKLWEVITPDLSKIIQKNI